jgi:hypothetical protein
VKDAGGTHEARHAGTAVDGDWPCDDRRRAGCQHGRLHVVGNLPIRASDNFPIVLRAGDSKDSDVGLPQGKEAIMDNRQVCRVVGLLDNGDRVALTTGTTRDNAERIVRLIEPHSAFVRLTIECDDTDNQR